MSKTVIENSDNMWIFSFIQEYFHVINIDCQPRLLVDDVQEHRVYFRL